MLVSGDDIGAPCHRCAFDDAIIARIFGYDIQDKIGVNHVCGLDDHRNEFIDLRPGKAEFRVTKNSGRFLQESKREMKPEITGDTAQKNLMGAALPAENGNDNVCVEDYFRDHETASPTSDFETPRSWNCRETLPARLRNRSFNVPAETFRITMASGPLVTSRRSSPLRFSASTTSRGRSDPSAAVDFHDLFQKRPPGHVTVHLSNLFLLCNLTSATGERLTVARNC